MTRPLPPCRLARLACAALIGGSVLAWHPIAARPAHAAATAASGSYLAGQHAYREADLGAAADYMIQALAADPDNPTLLRRVLVLQIAEGRLDSLGSLARRVADLAPGDPVAALYLSLEMARQENFDGAATQLLDQPARGLMQLTRPLLLAWLLQGQGDTDAALKLLSDIRQEDGLSLLASFHSGLLLMVAGRPEEATASLEALMGRLEAPPLRLVMTLGWIYESQGKTDKARALYESARRDQSDGRIIDLWIARLDRGQAPNPVATDVLGGLAEALYDIATGLRNDRATEAALIHAQLALHLDPGHASKFLLIGDLLQDQRRWEEAITAFGDVPDDSPYGWNAAMAIGESLNAMKRRDEAVAHFRAMSERHKDRHEALVRVGDLLRGQEKYQEAIAAYDAAMARIDQGTGANWTLYYVRGIAHERAKQWALAESDFQKALDLQPEQPLVLNYLAYSWIDQDIKLDEAHEMIERAVAQRPTDGYIVDSLGWVLYRKGRFEDAVRQLERAIELQPNDPVINDHLGDAYWQVGRRLEARFQWQRVLTLKPEDKSLIEAVDKKLKDGLPESATRDAKRGG